MTAKKRKKQSSAGDYLWRGGKRIRLEREEGFFTVQARSQEEVDRISALPGVQSVAPVQSGVFKVAVDSSERDAAMNYCRSEEIDSVCHHAYRPKNATNTRYYLTDRITVKFKPNITPKQAERIIAKAGTTVLRDYPGAANTYLLRVTRAAGKKPGKSRQRSGHPQGGGLRRTQFDQPVSGVVCAHRHPVRAAVASE